MRKNDADDTEAVSSTFHPFVYGPHPHQDPASLADTALSEPGCRSVRPARTNRGVVALRLAGSRQTLTSLRADRAGRFSRSGGEDSGGGEAAASLSGHQFLVPASPLSPKPPPAALARSGRSRTRTWDLFLIREAL